MMHVNDLIELVRVETENLDFSDTKGISDKEIIRHLNVGTRIIQSKIVGKGSKEFTVKGELLKNTDSSRVFEFPSDTFMRSKLSGLWVDGCLKKQVYIHNLNISSDTCCNNPTCCDYHCLSNYKDGYAVIGNKVYLTGHHCGGPVTVMYVKASPTLDHEILPVEPFANLNIQGGSLIVSSGAYFDSNKLKRSKKYTLVDEDGNQVIQNIKIESYESATAEIILSAKNPETDITSTENLYLVEGANASTHSHLEPLCTDYIVKYAIAKVLQRDGSGEYQVHSSDLVMLLDEILDAYTLVVDDVYTIPHFREEY